MCSPTAWLRPDAGEGNRHMPPRERTQHRRRAAGLTGPMRMSFTPRANAVSILSICVLGEFSEMNSP
jgi:hypothetical protein